MSWSRIEITSGVLSQPARIYCGNVTALDFEDIGKTMFFVEGIEPDGGRIVLYDGLSYAAAIVTAGWVGAIEDAPVHDLVVGGVA